MLLLVGLLVENAAVVVQMEVIMVKIKLAKGFIVRKWSCLKVREKVELVSYLSKLLKFILCQKDFVDEDIITVDRTSNTQVFAKNPPPKPSTLN